MKQIVKAFFLVWYSHRKKRMKQLQKKLKSGTLDVNEDDPFELFIAATNIRYCYYNETHKILGNTYGMCVLQVSELSLFIPFLMIHTTSGYGYLHTAVFYKKSLYPHAQMYFHRAQVQRSLGRVTLVTSTEVLSRVVLESLIFW